MEKFLNARLVATLSWGSAFVVVWLLIADAIPSTTENIFFLLVFFVVGFVAAIAADIKPKQ